MYAIEWINIFERNYMPDNNFREFYVRCFYAFESRVNYYSILKRSFMTKLENVTWRN